MAAEVPCLRNFIGGGFHEAVDGELLPNISSVDGSTINRIPRSKAEDVEAAVLAAREAMKAWKQTSAEERAEWLDKIADAIEGKISELALMEARDTGKPVFVTNMVDIPRAVANFRFFASALRQDRGETSVANGALNYSLRQPIGIAGLITPWNLPLYLLSWKVAPALAMGNVIIAKPSELTPSTANALAEICSEIGLPAGVLNVVHGLGRECGHAIVEHKDIACISFTGGTSTGEIVARTAAPMFKKLSLELGGKNPTIVCDDCDLDKTIAGVCRALFLNQGQICLCGSRLLVQDTIFDAFLEGLVRAVQDLGKGIGDPLDPSTRFGALISTDHLAKIESYVALAKEEGGTILCGGDRPEGFKDSGAFYLPTLIQGLDYKCRCATEEIFGPVVTIHKFSTDEEALTIANHVKYGLAANIWTESLSRAHLLAEGVECGIVWVNCFLNRDLRTPFGGWKASGVGREGGIHSLEFYSEAKNICIQLH